ASPSAAAADVRRTLEESAAPFEVWLRPTRVQGAEAAADLVAGLEEAARARPDLVLLTRGGGSLEDLWAFNEEAVVRAVAACPVPVLAAIGHESDSCLCDFAADARAKTPTAAAVELCQGWEEARQRCAALAEALEAAGREGLAAGGRRLRELRLLLREQRPSRRVERLKDRLHQLHAELVLASGRRLQRRRLSLERAGRGLSSASPASRAGWLRQRLAGLGARLEAGSPTALLERGYALVELPGRPGFLRRAADAAVGQAIRVRLARGELDARVEGHPAAGESGGQQRQDGRE
ncbi:MAG: exodeoxyribonuclease VII large subunit, partial [Planctomycetes bacterium]|nr:exodeoxyribonuclease VII large subunit [Planctomycetota bacterium]